MAASCVHTLVQPRPHWFNVLIPDGPKYDHLAIHRGHVQQACQGHHNFAVRADHQAKALIRLSGRASNEAGGAVNKTFRPRPLLAVAPSQFCAGLFSSSRGALNERLKPISGQTEGQARRNDGLRVQVGNSKIVNNM